MTDPAALAAARMQFQLTYDRAATPRRFGPGQLTGPWIPCAYSTGGDQTPGGWHDGGDDCEDGDHHTEDEWVDRYANYAINEAVHEALEWLRVDGRPWLDPHGKNEERIYELVNALCADLAALRKEA